MYMQNKYILLSFQVNLQQDKAFRLTWLTEVTRDMKWTSATKTAVLCPRVFGWVHTLKTKPQKTAFICQPGPMENCSTMTVITVVIISFVRSLRTLSLSLSLSLSLRRTLSSLIKMINCQYLIDRRSMDDCV